MKKILIIEDDKYIAELERDFLIAADYEVEWSGEGKKVWNFLKEEILIW